MRATTMSIVFIAAISALVHAQGAIITGRGHAKDGDSIWIGIDKARVDVRLYGIDAPEHDQECADSSGGKWRCGVEASKALGKLVNGNDVHCDVIRLEPTGARRPIAKCYVGTLNLNDEMIRLGLAWAFVEYLRDAPADLDHYSLLEAQAKAEGINVWQAPTKTPRQFRAERWDRYAARSPQKGCPVIAYVRSKKYYTPWSRNYARMFEALIAKPDDLKRVWFCTTDEAAAQGYSPGGR